MIVLLSWAELMDCGHRATMRLVQDLKAGRPGRYGASMSEGRFEKDWIGCVGENAVAKYLNRYWSGAIGDLSAADVSDRVQVRSRSRANYDLILHEADADLQPFVLALVHDLPRVHLAGWLLGHQGKRKEFWKDPAGGRPAYFVPQSRLSAMSTLEAFLEERQAAA